MNTLANILSACINSAGSTSVQCKRLFCGATPGANWDQDSFSCSIALTPTNTLQAAHAIVTNPQSNVSTIYGVTPPPGVQQFTPTLSTAPDGWELALNFTQTDFNQPRGVAIDGTGNVWVVNYVAGTVTKLDPNGAKLVTSSGSGNLNNPTYAAIDTSGNAWITNLGSNTVTKLNSDGSFAINYSTTFNQPQALAIDASGNKWVTNSGFAGSGISFSVTKIDTGGTLTNYAPSGAAFSAPIGIAISSSTGNLWVTNTVSPGSISTMVSDGSSGSNFNPLGSSLKFPQDLKLDKSGNVWVANQNNSVLELNSAGSQLNNFTPSALNNPLSLVIDSGANVWVTNANGNSVVELTSGGAVAGKFTAPGAGFNTPYYIALDRSGNVWSTNNSGLGGAFSVSEMIGAAGPVVTPSQQCLINGGNVCTP
jgi:streptogramin lyase